MSRPCGSGRRRLLAGRPDVPSAAERLRVGVVTRTMRIQRQAIGSVLAIAIKKRSPEFKVP